MQITFDPVKRETCLRERGLDFARGGEVFVGRHATLHDVRRDYGEERFITAGLLDGRLVVMVWTPRGDARRVISMRHAHADEERRWHAAMDRP